MLRQITSMFLLLAPIGYAYATPIDNLVLPSQLQACVDTNECTVDVGPTTVIGQMAAYSFVDNRQGAAVSGYALHYSLLPPSGESDSNSGITPYGGDIWLTVQDSYDLTLDSNLITVYTDTVNPQPNNILNDSNGLDIDVLMANTALLAGSGFEITGLDAGNAVISQGNMQLQSDFGGTALLTCVAEGCQATADLNLIYLSYIQSGNLAVLQFNQDDSRGLLYELTSEFSALPENGGFSTAQSYYVAAVPVPAAFWLFASGLLGLVGMVGRKSRV